MTLNYSAKAASAKKMLDRFGVFGYVKINRPSGATDPINGDTVTYTEYDLTAVDLKVGSDLIAQGLIESTDRMIVMSSDTKPLKSDMILIGAINHKIITIEDVNPAGTSVIFKVVCRA